MAERVQWAQPKRLNWVSGTMLVLAVVFGYWMWRFFPAYFDAWTVDHVLLEGANSAYRASRLGEPARTNALHELVDKAKADIQKKANVEDPELTVGLDLDGDIATLTADYMVTVTHPVLSKVTQLHFHREEKANIKAVDWDK
jgi:hypothetical protein